MGAEEVNDSHQGLGEVGQWRIRSCELSDMPERSWEVDDVGVP